MSAAAIHIYFDVFVLTLRLLQGQGRILEDYIRFVRECETRINVWTLKVVVTVQYPVVEPRKTGPCFIDWVTCELDTIALMTRNTKFIKQTAKARLPVLYNDLC